MFTPFAGIFIPAFVGGELVTEVGAKEILGMESFQLELQIGIGKLEVTQLG